MVADNYVVEVDLGTNYREHDGNIKICIWDTPGQEDYPRLRPLAYANAHIILICFAIDDRISLENIEEKACHTPRELSGRDSDRGLSGLKKLDVSAQDFPSSWWAANRTSGTILPLQHQVNSSTRKRSVADLSCFYW